MSNQLSQRLSLFYSSKMLPWVIICVGIILRLREYLNHRSLWYDEAIPALNVINRPFSELLQPLNIGVPIGFLMIEKLIVQVFGNDEYALRLFPLLCGIISLFLFYRVARWFIKPKAIPIALGLFAISDRMILYSSEFKQYSSDVTISLLLYLVTFYIQSKNLTIPSIILFGSLGAIAIWFSHPSVFVLAGVGISLAIFCLVRKEGAKIGRLSIAYSLWVLSFVVCYFVSLRDLSYNKFLLNAWAESFMPFPPLSFSDATWFVTAFVWFVKFALGLSFGVPLFQTNVILTEMEEPYRNVALIFIGALTLIVALIFFVGCISMFFEKREKFFMLISPIFFTLFASGLHAYPFRGRLLLFFVPSVLLFIGEGAGQISDRTMRKFTIIGVILVGLLFFHPLLSASYHLVKPRRVENIRPAISYIIKHQQEEDIFYFYCVTEPVVKYYSDIYGFKTGGYTIGIASLDNRINYINDLDKLRGNKRVWILFSNYCKWSKWKGVDAEKFSLYHLDRIGTRLDSFISRTGTSVYLYDLTGKTSKTVK